MVSQKAGTQNRQTLAGPRFEAVGGVGAELGESPFWDHANHIWWVDISGRKLLRTQISTRATCSWPTPEMPGFVVLTGPDRAAIGMESGIFTFSPKDGIFTRIVEFRGAGQRFNDATVDGAGRLWVTTLAMDGERGRGAVHAVTRDLTLNTVLHGLTTPNGLAADPAGRRLFVSDSHPAVRAIWTVACDFDTGEVGPRKEFANTRGLAGRPDGAALSADGDTYWIAGVDGGELYGFGREGLLDHVVPVPFEAPTKLAFFPRGIAVTAKSSGSYGGHIAVAMDPPPQMRGAAIPFWRADRA